MYYLLRLQHSKTVLVLFVQIWLTAAWQQKRTTSNYLQIQMLLNPDWCKYVTVEEFYSSDSIIIIQLLSILFEINFLHIFWGLSVNAVVFQCSTVTYLIYFN